MSIFNNPIPPKIDKTEELTDKMRKIEKEYDGFSSIPMNHPEYWALRKELIGLKK